MRKYSLKNCILDLLRNQRHGMSNGEICAALRKTAFAAKTNSNRVSMALNALSKAGCVQPVKSLRPYIWQWMKDYPGFKNHSDLPKSKYCSRLENLQLLISEFDDNIDRLLSVLHVTEGAIREFGDLEELINVLTALRRTG